MDTQTKVARLLNSISSVLNESEAAYKAIQELGVELRKKVLEQSADDTQGADGDILKALADTTGLRSFLHDILVHKKSVISKLEELKLKYKEREEEC